MPLSTSPSAKGKEKTPELPKESSTVDDSSKGSTTSSASESDSDSSTDSDADIASADYLESLLQKAKVNLAEKAQGEKESSSDEFINLGEGPLSEQPLPDLDPGSSLPAPYFKFNQSKLKAPKLVRDEDSQAVVKQGESSKVFLAPELRKLREPLTKKEKKALKTATAGSSWFDLPAPAAEDLPRLYREVEALRLRNHLDPKRFYRRDEGEGKGIKGLPKYFAMGKIVATSTPFKTTSSDNLTRAERKRSIVDELVADTEARIYAKRKYDDLQQVRGERGRGTLRKKMEARKPKW